MHVHAHVITCLYARCVCARLRSGAPAHATAGGKENMHACPYENNTGAGTAVVVVVVIAFAPRKREHRAQYIYARVFE